MTRILTALGAVLLCAGAAAAADDKKVTVRWHGQSFFEVVSSAGTRIVIDPHAIPAYGRKTVKADLILCTHPHTDHTQVGVVENVKEAKRYDGVTGTGQKAQWVELKGEKFKDVTLYTVGTYHDDVQGMKRGLNSIFVIEVDGLRIAHLGDLGHALTENMIKRIGPVDVLMVPVGGVYTINGTEAKEVVKQLKPTRYVLPMHYGTEVYDDLLSAKEFLDEQKYEDRQSRGSKNRTNELVIDAAASKPASPTIVILNWEK